MTNPEITKITPERIADTVEKTADFLEEQGWTYGVMSAYDYNSQSYSYCTLGALAHVEDEWQVRVMTEKHLACALAKLSDGATVAGTQDYPRVAKWNDRHRNGKNVIKKLRAAAAKIRAGECS